MNGAWLKSVLIIFILGNLTWLAAGAGAFVYWHAADFSELLEINRYALSNLIGSGSIAIEIPAPARVDSLQRAQKKLTVNLAQLEDRIRKQQAAADSIDFEILLRQVKVSGLDSMDTRAQEQVSMASVAQVRQMAKIMATSSPETIGKMANGLDDSMLARIVDASSNRDAAKILGALAPERVSQVVKELAGEQASK
jgi:hypothetical protein